MLLAGFTLLEFSLVLVFVGLLSGGVIAGREMVRQADLRSVMQGVGSFEIAINSFRQKYRALPGDMRNATVYWGDKASVSCPGGICPAPYTRNGNGNGLLTMNDVNGTSPEFWEAWRHLANAQLIDGKYTGDSAQASLEGASVGVNVPQSKISGVGYMLHSATVTSTGDSSMFSGNYQLILSIGRAQSTPSGTLIQGAGFSPIEMRSIDGKIDDGKPGTGILRAYKNVELCNDTNSQSAAYSSYFKTETCSMIYSLSGDPGQYQPSF